MAVDTSSLNPAQAEAVNTLDSSILILAGTGTGKTRTVTSRTSQRAGMSHLAIREIENGLKSLSIYVLLLLYKAINAKLWKVLSEIDPKA